jgi:translation initiation factor 1
LDFDLLLFLNFMDLQEQLKKLFPNHEVSNEPEEIEETEHELYVQKEPMICKYEKRKGKATTIISGYEGEDEDFKILAKEIKSKLVLAVVLKTAKSSFKAIIAIK